MGQIIMSILGIAFLAFLAYAIIHWIVFLGAKASSSVEKDSLKKAEKDAFTFIHNPMSDNPTSTLVDSKSQAKVEDLKNILRIGVCFSRLALKVIAAQEDETKSQIKLNSIVDFFQGADEGLIGYITSAIRRDLDKPENIDWNYNLEVITNLLDKEEYHFFDVIIFDGLLYVALSDGEITEKELATIFSVMSDIGWSEDKTDSYVKSRFGFIVSDYDDETKRKEALDILGLDENVTNEMIKKRYRELVKLNHPDLFAHMGDVAKEKAEKRFITIKEAYEYLTREKYKSNGVAKTTEKTYTTYAKQKPASQKEAELKHCPFCDEKIKAKAIKCKHCKSFLGGE